jgi:hypothetical protein
MNSFSNLTTHCSTQYKAEDEFISIVTDIIDEFRQKDNLNLKWHEFHGNIIFSALWSYKSSLINKKNNNNKNKNSHSAMLEKIIIGISIGGLLGRKGLYLKLFLGYDECDKQLIQIAHYLVPDEIDGKKIANAIVMTAATISEMDRLLYGLKPACRDIVMNLLLNFNCNLLL